MKELKIFLRIVFILLLLFCGYIIREQHLYLTEVIEFTQYKQNQYIQKSIDKTIHDSALYYDLNSDLRQDMVMNFYDKPAKVDYNKLIHPTTTNLVNNIKSQIDTIIINLKYWIDYDDYVVQQESGELKK